MNSADLIWKDISKDVEAKHIKANPFGLSQCEIWHVGKQIGWISRGEASFLWENYKGEVQDKDLKVEAGFTQDEWDAIAFSRHS